MSESTADMQGPYKAALVAAARDYLRAAGREGSVIEIPATVPPCVIVLGAQENVGALLRTTSRAPMVGGRRAGDPPADELDWDEPAPGVAGLSTAQLSKAARHMSDRSADACGVDREDNWKVYGQEFIQELRDALAEAERKPAT